MEYPRFVSNNFLTLLIGLIALGYTTQSLWASPKPPPPPKPTPPRCQQDNMARPIGTRFLLSDNEHHYAQVIPDPTDARYVRVVTDGIQVQDRFDANSVGPIVYRSDGASFAFIAAQNGQKYILEYASAGVTPYVAQPIEQAWNNWVCYGASGNHLVALAKHNGQWRLLVRPEQPLAPFAHIPLNGNPSSLELTGVRPDGSEGFQYQIEGSAMQMEITSWLR